MLGPNGCPSRWYLGVSDPGTRAEKVLRDVFGYPAFRGDQKEIVTHVAGGNDALVLMPTGGGKSLCYQIPALLREGMGVVVSPLIALMQDQVAALEEALNLLREYCFAQGREGIRTSR